MFSLHGWERQREQSSQQSEAEYYMQMEIEKLKSERAELINALKNMDECYCNVGYEMSRDEELAHRQTLINVRGLIKRLEGSE